MNVWQTFSVQAQTDARAGRKSAATPSRSFSFLFPPNLHPYEKPLRLYSAGVPAAMRPHRHRADAPPSPTHRQGHSTPSHYAAATHDAGRCHPAPAHRNGHGRHGAAQQLADEPLRGLSDL